MHLKNPDIRFEVTNRCNFNCVMCPREKLTRPKGVMNFELFKKVCDEGIELGMKQASLVGYGEPLMDPGFFDKAEYAKSKGVSLYTLTNATLLDREAVRKFREVDFDCIRISCYGVDRESYIRVHKCDKFDLVMNNLDYLFQLKKSSGNHPKVEVYFLLTDENLGLEEEFKRLWLGRADDISIWKPHNWSNGRQYRGPAKHKESCGRPMKGPLQIQWDGSLIPCCWCYNGQIIVGNANQNSLTEILKGEACEKLREAHRKKEFWRYPFCDGCDQLEQQPDSLVFTTIKNSQVGRTNTNQFRLEPL